MSSSICKSFESNAWRSDLCSHCFQSKEEHGGGVTSSDPASTGLGSRYQSVLNQSRSSYRTSSSSSLVTPTVANPSKVKAILKNNKNKVENATNKSVNFPDADDDAQVIGYGGQECFESSDDDETDHNNKSDEDDDDDDLPFTDEERLIHNQTQKNTSFNSVSRNLLAAEVATFKSHGVSSTVRAPASAPLVTIRPFGQSTCSTAAPRTNGPDCPKINLVSPMRNGQVLTGRNNKEEIKNRENLLKKNNHQLLFADPIKTSQVEKITSFSDPVPAPKMETSSPETPPVSSKALVLQSSKVASGRIESDAAKPAASNRITLTRKPPVWREKPRIPIKPQSVANVEPVPSAVKSPTESVQQPQMKVQKAECQPGQISIRFVHLSPGDDSDCAKQPASNDDDLLLPPLVPAANKVDNKELSALQRLDLLECTTSAGSPSGVISSTSPERQQSPVPSPVDDPEVTLAPDVVEAPRTPSPVLAPIEMNNNPIKAEADKVRTLPEQPKSPRMAEGAKEIFSSDSRSSSTRGLTRSAFEALRANLAGTLELSRVCQPNRASVNNTKRQAPPTPADSSASSIDSVPHSPPPAPPPLPPSPEPEIPVKVKEAPVEVLKPTAERATSVSPRYRNSFICTSPEGSVAMDDDHYPRSVSLTRVERTDSQSMATKPPSIRKILKERATHFLQLADSSGSCGGGSSSSRLSRSERFAAENGGGGGTVSAKKGKGRFSLRKLLGLKKDGGWDEPAEPLPPKIRPEIVHPIDFHPVGQVQVVQGKVDTTDASIAGRSPTHDSISSTDSGRHSDLQRSDSSVGGSDCPSPANSHQSSSLKRGSLKGRPKPPPPPRLHSLDHQPTNGGSTPTNRPSRPPPPSKCGESVSRDVVRFSPSPLQNNRSNAAEYANLGDIRNGITPKKPERSSSMRTRERTAPYDSLPAESKPDGLHYDCVSIQQSQVKTKAAADEDGYIIPMRMKSSPSFSSVSSSSQASPSQRHSLTSFHPPQEGQPAQARRLSRPGATRQSRQDLHVKLEDHYGTVTGANFQALAQLLEQATSKRPLAPHFHELRRVKSQDLKWNVFGDHRPLLRTSSVTVVQSSWQNHDLLLSVYNDAYQEMADIKAPFAQPAVVNFTSQVPTPLLPAHGIKAGVEVFPPGQVAMLKQLPHLLAMELEGDAERVQHSLSILLQVCRAVEWLVQQKRMANKRLQLEEIVFYRENSQDAYRLLWLPQVAADETTGCHSVKEIMSSCIRLLTPLLTTPLADKLSSLLQRDVVVIDRICQFLEFTMFGPAADLIDGDPDPMDMFQRWLDVERASALNELIRTQGLWRVKLSVMEEFRLSFLISTSPHHLLDTSQI